MDKSRRKFVLSAAAAVPAVLTVNSLIEAESPKRDGLFAETHNFLIHPEVLVRLNDRFEVVSALPLAINRKDADLLPYVLNKQQIALDGPPQRDSLTLERLAAFGFQGELSVADIAGDLGVALTLGQGVDLAFNFNDSLLRKQHHSLKNAGYLSLDLLQANHAASGSFLPAYIRIPIPVPFTNYNLQFRGPDSGGLRGCAPEVRRHWQLEVTQNTGIGKRTRYIANFHIAIWRSGKQICFAIANSEGRPPCWKKCTPTYGEIKKALQDALIKVGIPLAVAALMAAVVAALIYASPALVLA